MTLCGEGLEACQCLDLHLLNDSMKISFTFVLCHNSKRRRNRMAKKGKQYKSSRCPGRKVNEGIRCETLRLTQIQDYEQTVYKTSVSS